MSSIAATQVVPRSEREGESLELSVVMPCLNEAVTVGARVKKAVDALERHGIRGEVIVADNGSTDGSQQLAKDFGARVVRVERRGYGSALQGGIAASRGQFVLMGDADGVAADPGGTACLSELSQFQRGHRLADKKTTE